ncbi:MAG: 50S ribosomal protein L35 [Nitrospirae bacterium]|nr:MAG: 50S ribosomal protein L35 [Nitrospirota bacterium]
MPKMKTHKGTAKRVRITATGKLMLRTANPKRAKRSRPHMPCIRQQTVLRDLLFPAPSSCSRFESRWSTQVPF